MNERSVDQTDGLTDGWVNGWTGRRIAQYTGIEDDDASQPRKMKHEWKIQNVKRKNTNNGNEGMIYSRR